MIYGIPMKPGDLVWVHDIRSAEPRNFPGVIIKISVSQGFYDVLSRGAVTHHDSKYVWKFSSHETR